MLVFWKQSFIDKNETFDNGNAVHNCPKTGENSTMGPNSLYKAQCVKILKNIILQFQRKPVGLNSYVNAIYPKLLPISTKSLQNETIWTNMES